MTITEPRPELHLLPEGTRRVVYAENQPEYLALPSLRTPDGVVVTAWRPTPGELALLNEGVPVTLVLYTFNRPLQPVILAVGGVDVRETQG